MDDVYSAFTGYLYDTVRLSAALFTNADNNGSSIK